MTTPIEKVNSMDLRHFIRVFGNAVEHCQLCAASVFPQRPFVDVHHLHKSICSFIDSLPSNGKEGILRLHPDLCEKLKFHNLSVESQHEQKQAGLLDVSREVEEEIHSLNQQYKSTFGFPFVICVRENKMETILNGLKQRVQNSAEQELLTGIEEVKKICQLRLHDIVDESSVAKL